jgi:hypothetical protein
MLQPLAEVETGFVVEYRDGEQVGPQIERQIVHQGLPPMVAVADCCLTCRFYLVSDEVCRRYPPAVLLVQGARNEPDGHRSVFPPMQPTGWCGEHKPAEDREVLTLV